MRTYRMRASIAVLGAALLALLLLPSVAFAWTVDYSLAYPHDWIETVTRQASDPQGPADVVVYGSLFSVYADAAGSQDSTASGSLFHGKTPSAFHLDAGDMVVCLNLSQMYTSGVASVLTCVNDGAVNGRREELVLRSAAVYVTNSASNPVYINAPSALPVTGSVVTTVVASVPVAVSSMPSVSLVATSLAVSSIPSVSLVATSLAVSSLGGLDSGAITFLCAVFVLVLGVLVYRLLA